MVLMRNSNILVLLGIFVFIISIDCSKHKKRLLNKLFTDYNPLERPVKNENDTLEILIALSIQRLVDLSSFVFKKKDEKQQTLRMNGWLDYNWIDHNLIWNPEDFGNITIVRVHASHLWTPDVFLYNSVSDSPALDPNVNALIHYNGLVKYLPPGVFESTCQISVHSIPFDEQKCWLKFGSWSYDESKINLTAMYDSAQLDTYKPNGEWELLSAKSHRQSLKYECCVEYYPFVLFTIHIKRKTLYTVFNFIFPCVFISLTTILGFALPPESGEKVGLETINLLSIIMFLQLINTIIPESSIEIPTIGVYFVSVMVICCISVIANVGILILHHRSVKFHEVPPWVEKWICGYLATKLGMKLVIKSNDNEKDKNVQKNHYPLGPIIKYSRLNEIHHKSNIVNEMINYSDDQIIQETFLMQIKKHVRSILKEIRCITKKIKDDDDESNEELKWKFAATVLDRLCLIVFSIVTVITTCVVLFTSENFFNFQ